MDRVLILATGGTISMRVDPAAGGAIPALDGAQLVELVPDLATVAQVDVLEFSRVGGDQLTPEMMLDVAQTLDGLLDGDRYAGAVVTQGTDTIEETSYLLDLLLATAKPVVVTGAMRNNSEVSPDGPRNLLSAVRVAAATMAHGLGVLVVLDDQIYAAVDVVKTHATAPSTFRGPGRGPLGAVGRRGVIIAHTPRLRQHIPTTRLETRVEMIKFGLGTDGRLVEAALALGARGLVLEGMGIGNFPERAEESIIRAAASVPVVLTSRVSEGYVDDPYAFPGAGGRLTRAGAILGEGLTTGKARIKLMVALGQTHDREQIRRWFEYIY